MKNNVLLFSIILMFATVIGCKKDDGEPTPTTPDPPKLCDKKVTDCTIASKTLIINKGTIKYLYNKNGKLTDAYSYNTANQENDMLIKNEYDNEGRLIDSTYWAKSPGTKPGVNYISQKIHVVYSYNGNSGTYTSTQTDTLLNDISTVVYTGQVILNENGKITYDKSLWSNGEVYKEVTWTYNEKTNLLEKRHEIVYDSLGRLEYTRTEQYVYDQEGKLTNHTLLNAGKPSTDMDYEYNECDELIKAFDNNTQKAFTYSGHEYDAKGNLMKYSVTNTIYSRAEYTYYCP